ncbi:MAG TPA: ABC transporter permease subunit [Pseudonocardia sp.]|jgi:peptide/nickel transport system permease protein
MTRWPSPRRLLALGMTLVPVLTAVLGPALAGLPHAPPGGPYAPSGPHHLLGTDGLGRDVLTTTLQGGRSILLLTLTATLLAYLLGGLAGLAAATGANRLVEQLLLRPLDVVVAIPALLLVSVAAVWLRGEASAMALVIAFAYAPRIARIVHAAALDAAGRGAVEAMRQQRESWACIHLGYIGRAALRPVVADLDTRIVGVLYLVASANFLGLGFGPGSPDWAVTIARNESGLLLQPWSVLAPATMIALLVVGVNLLGDDVLHRPRTARVGAPR